MHTVFIISTLILSFTKGSDDQNVGRSVKREPFDFDDIEKDRNCDCETYVIRVHWQPKFDKILTELEKEYDEKNHEDLAQTIGDAIKYYTYWKENEIKLKEQLLKRLNYLFENVVLVLDDIKALPTFENIFESTDNFDKLFALFGEGKIKRDVDVSKCITALINALTLLENELRQKLKQSDDTTKSEQAEQNTELLNSLSKCFPTFFDNLGGMKTQSIR